MRERPWRTPARRIPTRHASGAPEPHAEAEGSPAAARWATPVAWLVIAVFATVLLVIARGPHRIGAFDVESDFYGGYAPAYYGGYAPAYDNYGYAPAYYGGYGSGYYAPAYYGPGYRRVIRPAYAYGPRYYRGHRHRW